MLELVDRTCSMGIKKKRKKEAFLLVEIKKKKIQTKRRALSDATTCNVNYQVKKRRKKITIVRQFLNKTFCKCMTYISRLLEQ